MSSYSWIYSYNDYFTKRSHIHGYKARHVNDLNLTNNKQKQNKTRKKSTFPTILFERLVPFFGILQKKKIINSKTVRQSGISIQIYIRPWVRPAGKQHNCSHRGTIVLTQRLERRPYIFVFLRHSFIVQWLVKRYLEQLSNFNLIVIIIMFICFFALQGMHVSSTFDSRKTAR